MNETHENMNADDEIEEGGERPSRRGRIRPAVIAVAGVAMVLLMVVLIWYFSGGRGEAGRPVPPPRSTSMDDAPAETLADRTIALTREQVESAGIAIETVGEQLSSASVEVAATGVVEANAYRQTPVLALAGGVVRRISAQLGENVARGETLAVIFSDEFAQAQSRYVALLTETENARRSFNRSQRLVAINQPGRSELEQAAKQRKAAEAGLFEARSRYERTTRLLLIGAASREELEQDLTKYRTAEAELEEARLRESRATTLLPISAEVRAASEDALNKLRSAETELASARQRLILYGVPTSRVNSLRSASQVTSELAVPAPVSGTVTARAVNVGEVVEANKELLRVTDLSSVWVIAQVYERDIARLHVGSGASITSDAFPDRIFRGQVTYIDPQLDETTRTAKVRIEISNPDRMLKLGMYVRAAFGALGDAERTVPAVPVAAVQTIGTQEVVFVPLPDQATFEIRPVRLGPEANGMRPVIEGLKVGDKIVTTGSFTLRAEWVKIHPNAN